MFLNSNADSEDFCKQFVLNFDSDRTDRSSETENNSHPDSNTSPRLSLNSLKVRRTEIAPVHDSVALTPNRFYLWFTEDGDRWHIPIQLSLFEGWALLDLVCRERDREAIFKIVAEFVGVAIAGDAA